MRAKTTYCPEIEDERLVFNCMHYYMAPECFLETFGAQGIELGEVISETKEKAYMSCLKVELGIYKANPMKPIVA